MQDCRRRSGTCWRVALAVLIGIAGFASNTHAQTDYQIVASFDFTNGMNPRAGLIQGNDGSFYGTTYYGGANSRGTIFKIDAAGTLTKLHDFVSAEGANPQAGLIQATDGSFYGTTFWGGGTIGSGTIF